MNHLMQKHGLTVQDMMLLASLDELTKHEIQDLDFIEDRILIYKQSEIKW